jgi:Transposase DDE domain
VLAGEITHAAEARARFFVNQAVLVVVHAIAELHSSVAEHVSELVADKGCHSNAVISVLHDSGYRTYIAEPERGRRKWRGVDGERSAVYSNRRRITGTRGKRLLRSRGELIERPFAHLLETGGMRRTHLRGHKNILKRLIVHTAGFNLALVMRIRLGVGKPTRLQGQRGERAPLRSGRHETGTRCSPGPRCTRTTIQLASSGGANDSQSHDLPVRALARGPPRRGRYLIACNHDLCDHDVDDPGQRHQQVADQAL